MASVNCEICGKRMGSWSFQKTVYTYDDSDEIKHYFCSEEHLNEWKKLHLPAPIESTDMELLYHKKLDEYQVWLTAMSNAEDDHELKEYEKKAAAARREVLKLGELLGKD